ncbi:hypothetical protein PENSPDRAFT_575061 [Peniophora sp. CONT]|nr:hypothetical protein PENSPDRAFT_575061 [Peniophora sp. CONT]
MLSSLATLALWLAVAGCVQVPLVSTVELASARSSWTDAPSPDSTAADVFSSMNSLLQFWPNTIFRTGHTLVPSTIPAGTILHHGSFFPNATVPTSFEWLAFDFEHAYIFCAFDCHVFKFVANRDLKLLYLDGASAANFIGAMQTIDVLLYGEVPEPTRDWEEWERAEALCEWGMPLGLDGFVRMEFHFEVIYCNFSSDGLTLLEPLPAIPKLPPPGIPRNDWPGSNHTDDLPEGWKGTQLDAVTVFGQAMVAGEWHARAPGETRVRPHIEKAVSFYDPALMSLRHRRRGVPRTQHQLAGISKEDARIKVEEIEEVLRSWRDEGMKGSGADWASAMRQVEERYSSRLLELNDTLHATSYSNASAQAAAVRRDVLIMISPYVATADVASYTSNSTSWLDAPMVRCGTFATAGIRSVFSERFTSQELIILDAIEGTQKAICRVIGLIWLDAFSVESAKEGAAAVLIRQWGDLVDELLAWLDWASFRTCRPGCAVDELCYITTWPFVYEGDDPYDFEYTPRCISTHPRRRKDDPPGWPSMPPGSDEPKSIGGLADTLLERRANRRRRIEA